MKYQGTIARGVKAPIVREGDNIIDIVCESILNLTKNDNIRLNDGDIIAVTESIVATAQGNFVSVDDIADDVKEKFNNEIVGLVFPILSRNRFSNILRGISKGVKKLIIQLSYPADEVGNRFVSLDDIYDANINPYSDVFTKTEFKKIFPNTYHEFTGVDYIEYYQELAGENCEIIIANDPREILKYTKHILVANTHDRFRTKKMLLKQGATNVYTLDEILNISINNSGYNEVYGLLGSNLAKDNTVKLFPRDCEIIVHEIQKKLKELFNKNLEVMVYGDGAFKDPQGGIWELCDPVVSPGFTNGLRGTPNEIKLKYIAQTKFASSPKELLEDNIKKMIKEKDSNLFGNMASQGTTPRQITDLLGSLADLVSGSGDKGTPIVLIQNYFTNYATE